MLKFRRRRTATIVAVLVAALAAMGAYAFTAGNAVPAHDNGVGVNTDAGYTVTTHPTYTYSDDGTSIIDVTFQLDKAANDVAVWLGPTGSAPGSAAAWTHCGAVAANTDLTCTFSTPVVNDPTGLNNLDLYVAATDTGLVKFQ